jgi:hypothetical protein
MRSWVGCSVTTDVVMKIIILILLYIYRPLFSDLEPFRILVELS